MRTDSSPAQGASPYPQFGEPPGPGRSVSAWSRYFAHKIFAESVPLDGTPGSNYIAQACGIDPAHLSCDVLADLRYHPECPEGTGGPHFPRHPALILASRDGDGVVRGIHRVFLRSDGLGRLPRRDGLRPSLGKVRGLVLGRIRAGCRVAEAQSVEQVLAALASGRFDAGVIALSPNFLGRHRLPRSCSCAIFGGRDNAEQAVRAVRARAQRLSGEVRLIGPPPAFSDVQQLVRAQGVPALVELIDGSTPLSPNAHPREVLFLGELQLPQQQAYVIKGLLGAGDLSAIFGPPGSLKSFLAIDIAMHVALGQPWQGRRVVRGAVVYVALEGFAGAQRRFIGQRLRVEKSGNAEPIEVPLALFSTALDLCGSDADVRQVIRIMQRVSERAGLPMRLVIIDTLARALGCGDENAGPHMGALLRNLGRIQTETGAHVLVVHHVGKDPARGLRGHSSLLAALDTAIEIKREPSRPATATIVKQKDGPDGDAFRLDLEPIEIGIDADGDPIVTATVRYLEPEERRAAEKSSRPMRQRDRALEALNAAIQHEGAEVPGQQGLVGVHKATWQEACARTGVFSTDKGDSIRRSFQRLLDDLRQAGQICSYGDWVWRQHHETDGPDAP